MTHTDTWIWAIAICGAQFAASVGAQTTGSMTEAEIAAAFAKQINRGLVPVLNDPETVDTSMPTPPVVVAELPAGEEVLLNIRFDFDSSALRSDQKPLLVAVCNAMKAADAQLFRIIGHTDSSGSASYNENLSKLRAEEVKRHLEFDCGIPGDKMEAVGAGARYPQDPANPRADVNRRVEFQALS